MTGPSRPIWISKQADQQKAESALALANITFDRTATLRKTNAVSQQDFDNAKAACEQAAAVVAGAKAAVESARLNLEWCRVLSPIDGRVSYKKVTVGNLVNGGAGQAALLTTVESVSPVFCYVDVDENSVLKYQKLAEERKLLSARDGKVPCYVELGNEAGFPHQGAIDFEDNHVDPATGTMRVRGVLQNQSGRLIPGLFARMRVPGSGRYRALLVPDAAIGNDQSQHTVLVVDKDNKVQVRPVQLGALFGDLRAIVSGISADDLVVTNGQMHARPGSIVTPTEVPIPERRGVFRSGSGRCPHGPASAMPAAPMSAAGGLFACLACRRAGQRGAVDAVRLFLHRAAGLCRRDFDRHGDRRRACPPRAADRAVPRDRPAHGDRHRQLSRRQRQDRGRDGGHADRRAGQRRRGHDLHVEPEHERRQHDPDCDVQTGHEPGHRPGAGPEPRGHRAAALAAGRAARRASWSKKASPNITLGIAVYSPDGSRDPLYVSNYVTLQVKDELARLPGVGDLTIFGARDYSMRLWLNPEHLAARNLTVGDVITAVQEQNVQVAAGIVGGPPLPAGKAQFPVHGQCPGAADRAQGLRRDHRQDRRRRQRDPRERRGARRTGRGRLQHKHALQRPAGRGHRRLPVAGHQLDRHRQRDLQETGGTEAEIFLPGIDYAIPYDTTTFVRDSIQDVTKTLFEAVGLVALVVLVFLQSWRASLVPLLAIPVSLIGTFAVMWVFGFSLNNLSLFGLVLAIGIVVDDAIVVVENVDRWIEQGLSPRDAAYRAMEEVTPAVLAIAVGLTAVFVPVAFISGITGQFYRQFALTISFSTLLSAFNSLTLSPALAALILKPHAARKDWLSRPDRSCLGLVLPPLQSRIGRAECGLRGSAAAGREAFAPGASGLCRPACSDLFGIQDRFPSASFRNRTRATSSWPCVLPDASSIDRTDAVLSRLSDIAMKVPGIEGTFAITGLESSVGHEPDERGHDVPAA